MKLLRFLALLLALTGAIGIGWHYYWTVGSPRVFAGQQQDYYNLLIDGFQDGQLAMKATPDPWLGVDNTKAAHYLLDASFYQGKYYLYFGATPAVLLLWPWTLVTGHDLPEGAAAALFAVIAFLLSLGWLRTLQRSFASQAPIWFWPVSVLMLGIATGYTVVLRRPLFYEIAILAGVACSMGTLWCLTLAILRPERAVWWLAWGSLGVGLAAGSRPTLVPGGLLAVAGAAFYLWRSRRAPTKPLLLAAGLPLGVCGLVLAWYNWARFGHPLEFGLHYQLGSNGHGFPFTLASLRLNLGLYYFTPPDFSWFFPFFAPGPKPLGSYPEQVHGQFYLLPLVLLAAWGAWRTWRSQSPGAGIAVPVALALAWAGATLLFDGMAPPHSNRYQLDFHPVFVVVTVAGLLALAQAPGPRWPVWAALAWCVPVILFNLCTSFHVHGFFRASRPREFERIARAADRLVWPLYQLAGPRLGGFEAVVRFPEGRLGTIEPLVVMGGGVDMDALVVKYTAPGRGQLAFIHLQHGEVESEEFALQPGKARWLKIHPGSLYPPPWHPWYDSLPPDMARAAHRIAVKVDGVEVLNRDTVCYPASANQVWLGERAGFLIGEPRFTGEIERVRGLKADTEWLQGLKEAKGSRRLRVLLPRDRFGSTEPLLLTGEPGRTEFLAVTYVRPGVVRLSFIHEGWSLPLESPEIEWDYLQPLEVLVDLGPERLKDPEQGERGDGVTVEVAGEVVFSQDFVTHPARPAQVYVGCTPWPMSGSRPMFGGHLVPEPPQGEEPALLRRAKQSLLAGWPVELRVTLPPRTGNQPIFTTGAPGIGDGLFVEYLSDTEVRLGFDHWGSQATFSEPFPMPPGVEHRLTVSLGAQLSAQVTVPGQLRVLLNGRPVFERPVDLFPADRDRLFFGANPIGLSTSGPVFGGILRLPGRARPAPPVTNP